jgi:hypothetical protein
MKHLGQGCYSISFIASRWILTLTTRTRDGYSIQITASGWILTLSTKTGDVSFTASGWILTLWPVILYVVSDHMGIIKFHKLWPRIYYRWLLGRDGYYQFPRIVTRASFLLFPWRQRVLPCKCNIVFLCVVDNLYGFELQITWSVLSHFVLKVGAAKNPAFF